MGKSTMEASIICVKQSSVTLAATTLVHHLLDVAHGVVRREGHTIMT